MERLRQHLTPEWFQDFTAKTAEHTSVFDPRSLTPAQTESPPQMAEWLFAMFAPRRSVGMQLGDLQEMYEKDSTRFGVQRAKRLYWTRVIRSTAPAIAQKVKKIGLFGIIADYARTKLGL